MYIEFEGYLGRHESLQVSSFLYLSRRCYRAAPIGNLCLVNTVVQGELQFFMPGLFLVFLRVREVGDVPLLAG